MSYHDRRQRTSWRRKIQRNLDLVDGAPFDLAVVGGGIVGAFCACDAARRGLRVLLVDKDDFGAGTSEGMSHLVHGGIRYLVQGRFGLVREALAERNRWRRFAPHRVAIQPFLMPVATGRAVTALTRRAGVALFDRLGRGLDGGEPMRWLDARAAVAMEPALAAMSLAGACLYDECRVDEPERVVLALIADAVAHGAVAANHLACTGLAVRGGRVDALHLTDGLTGDRLKARPRAVINAAGSAADEVAAMLLPGQAQVRLSRSKGVHFVTRSIANNAALALSGGGRHAFIVPWMGLALVGTSDDATDNAEAHPEAVDLDDLEGRLHALLPGLGSLERLDAFAGVRALPASSGSTYTAARDLALRHHAVEGAAGLFAIYGGKWTTARLMAERAVDAVAVHLGARVATCDTAQRPLACTPDVSVADFEQGWRDRLPSWPAAEVAAWTRAYGGAMARVLAATSRPDALGQAERDVCRFAFAVNDEMAMNQHDIAHRLGRGTRLARPAVMAHLGAWQRAPQVAVQ